MLTYCPLALPALRPRQLLGAQIQECLFRFRIFPHQCIRYRQGPKHGNLLRERNKKAIPSEGVALFFWIATYFRLG